MDVKKNIQHYIEIYGGSEKRVISNVAQECKCKEEFVEANIKWLIEKKYLDVIIYRRDMNNDQKKFYDSDSCRILNIIKRYDENEYWEDKKKRDEEINEYSNEKKFLIFFKEMENKFDLNYNYNNKNYAYNTTNESAIIQTIDNDEVIYLDFANTCDWTYNESENNIFYKKDNCYYVVELYYLWGKCNVKHYCKTY